MDGFMALDTTRAAATRWFDDFFLGERFALPSRTLSAHHFGSFAEATGMPADRHDIYATSAPERPAHPLLIAIQTTVGAAFLPFLAGEAMLGIVEQTSRFVRDAFSGDTLYPLLQVTELEPGRGNGIVTLRSTVHNHRDELVLDGTQRWKLRNRPAVPPA